MKKSVLFFIILCTVFCATLTFYADSGENITGVPTMTLSAKGCILMEAKTGTVIFSSNANDRLPPASVTKIMTMLLVLEAVDSGKITLDDTVTASEHAASMGGTQIYLEVGEQMTVNDLFKAVAVPSANDAAVALAEYVAGTEEEFVSRMNDRAAERGMNDTHFTNCTGLFDDESHYTSAYDLAVATRELMKHEKIFDYTTIWTDSLRNGEFGLANTNKMLKTYNGMNGMKTGYTQIAGHCLSGTATRNGVTFIAVVLGSPSSKERFADVASMLDYGFASYTVSEFTAPKTDDIPIIKGKEKYAKTEAVGGYSTVIEKGSGNKTETVINMDESIAAPAEKGTVVGSVTYMIAAKAVCSVPIVLSEDVKAATVIDYFVRIIDSILK